MYQFQLTLQNATVIPSKPSLNRHRYGSTTIQSTSIESRANLSANPFQLVVNRFQVASPKHVRHALFSHSLLQAGTSEVSMKLLKRFHKVTTPQLVFYERRGGGAPVDGQPVKRLVLFERDCALRGRNARENLICSRFPKRWLSDSEADGDSLGNWSWDEIRDVMVIR